MERTRIALVRGIAEAVATRGARRTTMIDIAAAAGLAKATLYNHVRTRTQAYELLADAEVVRLVELLGADNPQRALELAAAAIAEHPVLRRLRTDEPAALAAVLLPSAQAGPRQAVVLEALTQRWGPVAGPLVMRWLMSLALDPGDPAQRSEQARTLLASAQAPLAEAVVSAGHAGEATGP